MLTNTLGYTPATPIRTWGMPTCLSEPITCAHDAMWVAESEVVASSWSKCEVTFCPCLFLIRWRWRWSGRTLMWSEHYMLDSSCRLVSFTHSIHINTTCFISFVLRRTYTSISTDMSMSTTSRRTKRPPPPRQFWCIVMNDQSRQSYSHCN